VRGNFKVTCVVRWLAMKNFSGFNFFLTQSIRRVRRLWRLTSRSSSSDPQWRRAMRLVVRSFHLLNTRVTTVFIIVPCFWCIRPNGLVAHFHGPSTPSTQEGLPWMCEREQLSYVPPPLLSFLSSSLGGAAVRASDFWPSGHRFDYRSGRYQAPMSTQPSIPPG